jgi:hypothetical protein
MKKMIRLFFALCLAAPVFNLQATPQDEEFQKIAGD